MRRAVGSVGRVGGRALGLREAATGVVNGAGLGAPGLDNVFDTAGDDGDAGAEDADGHFAAGPDGERSVGP